MEGKAKQSRIYRIVLYIYVLLADFPHIYRVHCICLLRFFKLITF